MIQTSVSHLSDTVLRRDLHAIVAQDRSTTARMLIHIAEFECRGLYRNEGYSTMHLYCVGELGMSEDIAYKRTRAARKAREFPRIFLAIADGRLTLSAVGLLVRYLTAETAADLLAAAERKTNAQVEELLAQRFPEPDSPTLVQPIHQQERLAVRPIVNSSEQLSEQAEATPVPLVPAPEERRPTVKPVSPQRYALQLTMSQAMHDKLRRAQDLLGHQISSGDVVQVLDRALDALIRKLEKRKFAATD